MASNGLKQFLKDNAVGKTAVSNASGIWGKIFGVQVIANIAQAQGALAKLRAGLMGLLTLAAPLNAVLGISLFKGMRSAIHSILKDTGSLEAALNRLTQIQGLQRALAPFVGGVEAARRKVAELVNFAAKANLPLSEVGSGAKTLQASTRGSFSGGKDLAIVGNAAAASGNNFSDASEAVAEFYETLREGRPIQGAADNLRQMGMITQATSDQLVHLQKNGSSASEIFNTLTSSLAAASGGLESLKGDLESVRSAHEHAKEKLKEKFASPWVETDIQNTKNYTEALLAIAPAAARVGAWYEKLTNGFSTAISAMAKWVAGNDAARATVELLTKALGVVVTVVGAISALSLAAWITGAGTAISGLTVRMIAFTGATGMAAKAIGALGIALKVAAIGSVLLIVATVIATIVGALVNFANAAEETRKALDELDKANRRIEKALREQGSAVKTLTDLHEALAAALNESAKAQRDLDNAISEGKSGKETDRLRRHRDETDKIVQEVLDKKKNFAPTAGEIDAEDVAFQKSKAQREQAFQTELEQAPPGKRDAILKKRIQDLQGKQTAAEGGVAVRATHERQSGEIDIDLQAATARAKADEEHLEALRKEVEKDPTAVNMLTGATDQLILSREDVKKARKKQEALGLNAPADSSVYAEAKAREAARNQDAKSEVMWQTQARRRRSEETPDRIAQLTVEQKQLQSQRDTEGPQIALAQKRADLERQIAGLREKSASTGATNAAEEYQIRKRILELELEAQNARPGGPDTTEVAAIKARQADLNANETSRVRDLALSRDQGDRSIESNRARRRGEFRESVALDDLSNFAGEMQKNLSTGFSEEEAKKRALGKTRDDIAEEAFNRPAVVDSLQSMGLGGNIGAADPMLDIARRQEEVAKRANDWLERIYTAVNPKNKTEKVVAVYSE